MFYVYISQMTFFILKQSLLVTNPETTITSAVPLTFTYLFKHLSAHCFGFTAQNFIAFVHSHCSHQSPASAGRKLYAAQRKRPYAYLPCRKWHTKVAASSSHLTRPPQHWRKFRLHQFSFRHNGRKKTVWLVCISACGNSVRELVLLVVSFYS